MTGPLAHLTTAIPPIRKNPLRAKLAEGRALLGLWVTSADAAVTEVAALCGLDWVCVDMEHGGTSFAAVSGHVRAARAGGLGLFVRVSDTRVDTIKRALDLGADGIVLPLVRGPEDIEAALDHVRFPPHGRRGLGGERAQGWGLHTAAYLAEVADDIILMPMIETREAAARIDDICAVEGLDFLFVGPGDLSTSLGHPGGWDQPETRAAIDSICAAAARHGVTTGIYGIGPQDIHDRIQAGFRIIAAGSDLAMMAARIRSDLAALIALRDAAD